MQRPPETLKALANRIARQALSEDSAQIVRLLRLSGYMGGAADFLFAGDAASNPLDHKVNPDHIGIWERKEENGRAAFVRRMEKMDEWHFWAPLGRIEPKGERLRVVLCGESVARGYLYDPEFTPAMALQAVLESRLGVGAVEVIDLARTSIYFEVRDVAVAALQLEPDLTVMFAGNNWCVSFPPHPSDVARMDAIMADEGIAGVKRLSEEQVAGNARRIVNDVSTAYQAAGVPLVWIIPEFNLGDWRDPITNAPHLAEGRNRRWIELLEEAEAAMRDGETERAATLARQMVELDEGVCVAGFYILAECARLAGDHDAERRNAELARDAVIWDSSRMVMPRTFECTKAAMRDEIGKFSNCQIVDAPALLKEHLGGAVPGRRIFLDYCHLTTEGIQVVAAAAASCTLRALRGVEVPWYALVDERIAPTRETEAEALFLAAVHSAHWWQPYDVVLHFCRRALKLSPHVADIMLNYIYLQTSRSAPMLMNESAEQISRLGSPLMLRYLMRYNDQKLDAELLDATVVALEEAGFSARERLERLRREEHSVSVREVNLLDYYYCSSANQPQETAWQTRLKINQYRMNEAEYYKAYWRESRFFFVGEAGVPVRLSLTLRLPRLTPEGAQVSVELNGRPQAEIEGAHEWATWDIMVEGSAVRDGLNGVTVRWPIQDFEPAAALERIMQDFFERKVPDFYAVFGEIYSFTAADGRRFAQPPEEAREELAVAQLS
ncbi:MAG: hypothetical protein ABW208_28775 [Pyrinomonadaceae bacterium]